jgi:two-component system, LytTR family, response regulator
MIRALILDDEINAVEYLLSVIKKHVPQVAEVFGTTDSKDADKYILSKQPQLLFLDVEMQGMTGFDFLAAQQEKNFDVIFTTAFSKYAIQAIRFSAIDYLLKPVQPDELAAAVERFLQQPATAGRKLKMYEHLFENLDANDEQKFKLSLNKSGRTYFIPPADIFYCTALSNYTQLFLKDETMFTVARTLKETEEMLDGFGFLRTHKSFLVNKKHILQINTNGSIVLTNKKEIEISRRRFEEIEKLINK